MSCTSVSKCTKAISVLFFLLEIVDLICDWFFYVEVRDAEQGLVFGTVDQGTVTAILVFTIVGSIAFPIELYTLVKGTICQDEDNSPLLDILSFLTVLLEDTPQAILLLKVSLCRPEPNSIVQYMKTGFVLLTALVKTIITLCLMCGKKKGKTPLILKRLNIVTITLTVIELLMTVMVFVVTHAELSGQGHVKFQKPLTITEEKFNDHSFFSNVGVFLHNPNFPFSENELSAKFQTKDESASIPITWLRLTSINDIKNATNVRVRLEYYSTNSGALTMLRIMKQENEQIPHKVLGCYRIKKNGEVAEIQCSLSFGNAVFSCLQIKFEYEESIKGLFKHKPLGDITFTAEYRTSRQTSFKSLHSDDFAESIEVYKNKRMTEIRQSKLLLGKAMILHYFKHSDMAEMDKDGLPLYKNEPEILKDVKEVWKTGWLNCPTTGKVGPSWRH